MASSEDDFGGSLFEGMVLFSPSDLSSSAPPPLPIPEVDLPPPPPSLPPTSPQSHQQHQPLDEDLFSDLTLQSQSQSQFQSQSLELNPNPINSQPLSRQISRKKKRAVRIGYARDSLPLDDLPLPPPPSIPDPLLPPQELKGETFPAALEEEDKEEDKSTTVAVEEAASQPSNKDDPQIKMEPAESRDQVTVGSIEDKLVIVRARIAQKLDEIQQQAVLLSAQRKEACRRRRKAMEDVGLVSEKYKELERELEEACEAEDFERAESVSESLAEKERVKDGLLSQLRDAEMECDAVDLKMHELLEMQIAAEEEGVVLLEEFAKDANNSADLLLKRAEEISSKELEEWESSMELLEVNKIELSIESHVVSDVRSRLESSIDHLVENDRKEVEILRRKQGILSKELDELLALVRLKEAEIAENDSQISEVEKKISIVISDFHGTQSSIDVKHDNLQLSLSKLASDTEALAIKKKGIDEFISEAQQQKSQVEKLASESLDEARACQDFVRLRKSLASSILKSREDKVKFAKTEETILEEIQILRQQISAARTCLQELSATRVSIQQEIASFNQRIDFVDKRGPELEAEKKVAAAARNFKEAGRIAAEAKALNAEKESLQSKKEKAVIDVEKLEGEITCTLAKIQESESLLALKEKEAAMAGFKRLLLVAVAAKAERSAALQMGDTEEGDSLLKEAEAAESKARELQKKYDLDPGDHEQSTEHSVSIALITNLPGQHLAEMTSSSSLPSSK